jgi:hypothetical protein
LRWVCWVLYSDFLDLELGFPLVSFLAIFSSFTFNPLMFRYVRTNTNLIDWLIDYVSSKKCFIHFVLIVNWKSNNYLIISCTILIYLYLYWKGSWNQAIGRGRLWSFAANDAWDSTLDKKSRLWSGTYVSIGCTIYRR